MGGPETARSVLLVERRDGEIGPKTPFFGPIPAKPSREMQTDQLSLTFAALADPTRRSILARLAKDDATVRDLAEPFAISLPAISRHLKVLESAGLIVRSRDAQWRPSRMQPEPLDEAVEWMQSRKQTWEARVDRLDSHLRRKGESP